MFNFNPYNYGGCCGCPYGAMSAMFGLQEQKEIDRVLQEENTPNIILPYVPYKYISIQPYVPAIRNPYTPRPFMPLYR